LRADAVGKRGHSEGRRHATLWQREQRAGAPGEVGKGLLMWKNGHVKTMENMRKLVEKHRKTYGKT